MDFIMENWLIIVVIVILGIIGIAIFIFYDKIMGFVKSIFDGSIFKGGEKSAMEIIPTA